MKLHSLKYVDPSGRRKITSDTSTRASILSLLHNQERVTSAGSSSSSSCSSSSSYTSSSSSSSSSSSLSSTISSSSLAAKRALEDILDSRSGVSFSTFQSGEELYTFFDATIKEQVQSLPNENAADSQSVDSSSTSQSDLNVATSDEELYTFSDASDSIKLGINNGDGVNVNVSSVEVNDVSISNIFQRKSSNDPTRNNFPQLSSRIQYPIVHMESGSNRNSRTKTMSTQNVERRDSLDSKMLRSSTNDTRRDIGKQQSAMTSNLSLMHNRHTTQRINDQKQLYLGSSSFKRRPDYPMIASLSAPFHLETEKRALRRSNSLKSLPGSRTDTEMGQLNHKSMSQSSRLSATEKPHNRVLETVSVPHQKGCNHRRPKPYTSTGSVEAFQVDTALSDRCLRRQAVSKVRPNLTTTRQPTEKSKIQSTTECYKSYTTKSRANRIDFRDLDEHSCASDNRSVSSKGTKVVPFHFATDQRSRDKVAQISRTSQNYGFKDLSCKPNPEKTFFKKVLIDFDPASCLSDSESCASNSRSVSMMVTKTRPFVFATDHRSLKKTSMIGQQSKGPSGKKFQAKPAPDFSAAHDKIKDRPIGKKTVEVRPFNFATDKRATRRLDTNQSGEKSHRTIVNQCNPQSASSFENNTQRAKKTKDCLMGEMNSSSLTKTKNKQTKSVSNLTEPKAFKFHTKSRAERKMNLPKQYIIPAEKTVFHSFQRKLRLPNLPTLVEELDVEDSSHCSLASTTVACSSVSSINEISTLRRSLAHRRDGRPRRNLDQSCVAEPRHATNNKNVSLITVPEPFTFATESRLARRKKLHAEDHISHNLVSPMTENISKKAVYQETDRLVPNPLKSTIDNNPMNLHCGMPASQYDKRNRFVAAHITEPHPFQFRTKERARNSTRKLQVRSAEEIELEECDKQFHAIPSPKDIFENTTSKCPVIRPTLKYLEIQPNYLKAFQPSSVLRCVKPQYHHMSTNGGEDSLYKNNVELKVDSQQYNGYKGSPISVVENSGNLDSFVTIAECCEPRWDSEMGLEQRMPILSTGLSFDILQAEWTSVKSNAAADKRKTSLT